MSGRNSRLHESMPHQSIQSKPPCHCQAETEWAQIVLNKGCLGLPVQCCQCLAEARMQAWRAWEWSWLVLAWQKWPKKDRCCRRIVSDRSGWPIWDRTMTSEMKSVQWIWRIRLRHQLSNASIFFTMVEVTDHTSEPYGNTGRIHALYSHSLVSNGALHRKLYRPIVTLQEITTSTNQSTQIISK